MEYSKIISVTGLPGLYELINTKSDGAIVRSLDDKTTRFASSRIHNFSHLESIEVFTIRENVNLAEVFQAMENGGDSLPDAKDNGAIRKYFEKVFPDIDFERVYSSDLKKMIKWFEALKKNNVEIKLTEPEPEEAPVEEKEPEKPVEQVKPPEKKKSPTTAQSEKPKQPKKKKTEEKKEQKTEAKPAKKAAKKKK